MLMSLLSAQNLFAIGSTILISLTLLLPKRFKYIVHGLFIMALGVLPILYQNLIIHIDLTDSGIFNFLVMGVGILAGRELFAEGLTDTNKILKISGIIFGIILIIITSVPSLYSLNAITFTLDFPGITMFIIYIVSGFLLLVGSFLFSE